MRPGHAFIRPARPPIAEGFVLLCQHATGRGTLSVVEWHFPTLEAARLFCTLCDFTWTLVVEPLELRAPRGRS